MMSGSPKEKKNVLNTSSALTYLCASYEKDSRDSSQRFIDHLEESLDMAVFEIETDHLSADGPT